MQSRPVDIDAVRPQSAQGLQKVGRVGYSLVGMGQSGHHCWPAALGKSRVLQG
jgi:hypothetical protein